MTGSEKELILGILTVAAGIANAYLWHGAVAAGALKNTAFYSLPVIALFLFAILFSFSAIFMPKRLTRTATAIGALGTGYLFVPYSATILSAAAVSALGGWYATQTIANEAAASNYFSTRKILRGGLPVFFTSVSLMLAVFYFSFVSGEATHALLPKAIFDAAIPLLQQPLQGILPGFRSDASVDELLLAFAAQQLNTTIDVRTLPPAERNRLVHQGREVLAQQFGITLSGSEKSSDVLYEVTNAQIAKFIGPYRAYLPFLAAVGFFITIKTFTLPVYWVTLILVFLVVKLLIATHILKKEKIMVEVEKINL